MRLGLTEPEPALYPLPVRASFYARVFFGLASLCGLAIAGACASSEPFTCAINSDCQLGAYCDTEAGECKTDCVDAERDCPRGYFCSTSGRCEYGGGGSGPGGGEDPTSAGGGGASSTTSTSSSSTTSSTTTGAGGGATFVELDLCNADADCGSPLRCEIVDKGGTKRCTKSCASNAVCPVGFRCHDPGDGSAACVLSDVGRSCSTASQCHHACFLGPGYCTAPCATGGDCPNGWGCMEVASQKVCVKAAEYCDGVDNSACVVPTGSCDLSPTMVIGGCVTTCSTAADCPQRAAGLAPWTCDAGGICRRPADVQGSLEGGYAPAQYACNGLNQVVNLCNDAQHIDFDQFTIPPAPAVSCGSASTTDGLPGDACVDSCRFQGGCRQGYACTSVGSIAGGRIGLCLPTGTGEVGAACTRDRDCAFGYCSQQKCSRDCSKDGLCPTGSTCTAAGGPNVEGLPFRRCQ